MFGLFKKKDLSPPKMVDVQRCTVRITLNNGDISQRAITGHREHLSKDFYYTKKASVYAKECISTHWNHGRVFEIEDGIYVPTDTIVKIQLFTEPHLVDAKV